MTAIHIPRISRRFVPPAKARAVVEPHWIDLTADALDTGFAERSAAYLASLGYTAEQVHEVLVDELDVAVDAAATIVARIAHQELSSAS